VIIAGPAHGTEEIITAMISLDQVRSAKSMIDVTGHYSRPDVFEVKVNGELVESLAPVVSQQTEETNTEQE
jgi:nitrilase